MVQSKKIDFLYIIFSLIGITAFTQTTIIPKNYIYILLLSTFFLSVFYFFSGLKIRLESVKFFLCYLLVFFTGLIGLFFGILHENRFHYNELDIFGRLINLLLLSTIFIFIDSYLSYQKKKEIYYETVLKWYFYGILFLIALGFWQLFSFYNETIVFPFETRSHLHSTHGYNYTFSKRITSIAQEPSYFTMFAIDFIALSLIFLNGLKKYFFLSLGLIMVFFSLSPSGYIVLIFSAALSYTLVLIKYSTIKPKSIILGIISALIIVFFFLLNQQIFTYIYSRIIDASPQESSRFYMNLMPFFWSAEGSLLNLFFGYGIKSYSIIGTHYSLPNGYPIHPTSNNIYVDVFWESGISGLILIFSFFLYLLIRILRSSLSKRNLFIALYVFFDLTISGLFRADFASVRFFILLYFLYIFPNIPYQQRKLNQ